MSKLRPPVLLLLVMLSLAVTWDRHMRLTRSLPEVDAVLAEAPLEIRLWFSEAPQNAVSRIGLDGPAGTVKTGPATETDDPRSFKVGLESTLAPGAYSVAWRAAGDDGHAIRGTFAFTVEAGR